MSTLPPDQVDILYPTAVLDKAYIPEDTFLRSFLLALPRRHIFFQYIALGVRLQSAADIIDRPFPKLFSNFSRLEEYAKDTILVLLFRGEGENTPPWSRPWFPDGQLGTLPIGLYIESLNKDSTRFWQ